jgi:hypothetical protein
VVVVVYIVIVVVVAASEILLKLYSYYYSYLKSFVLLDVKYICLCCVCNLPFTLAVDAAHKNKEFNSIELLLEVYFTTLSQ